MSARGTTLIAPDFRGLSSRRHHAPAPVTVGLRPGLQQGCPASAGGSGGIFGRRLPVRFHRTGLAGGAL